MLKSRRCGIRFLALLALLLVCAPPPPASADDTLVISPAVKAILDDYLSRAHPMAFAVSVDGTNADFVYCSGGQCNAGDPRHQRDALQYCGKGCVILAVGKEFKLPYRVGEIAINAADLPVCEAGTFGADFPAGMAEVRLSNDDCAGFRAYMDKDHFKAFATTDISQGIANWGRAARYDTVEEAVSNALEQCRVGRKRDGTESECRLFALGDIVVYDLSEAELRAATDIYRANKNATNADLPAN